MVDACPGAWLTTMGLAAVAASWMHGGGPARPATIRPRPERNAGRMAEPLIDHGRAIAADPETGEILAGQTLDATREHRYRKPANDVNDAPRQM